MGNLNATKQSVPDADRRRLQVQGGGEQLIGQSAGRRGSGGAIAATPRRKPSNENHSVRVLQGDDGSVEQTNKATSDATAANLNGTKQTATQGQVVWACRRSASPRRTIRTRSHSG